MHDRRRDTLFLRDMYRGAAWLSSARVVRCWVKSRNERNPYPLLLSGKAGHSEGTAGDKPEAGGDDVKSSRPLCPGLHTCYNGRYRGQLPVDRMRISKAGLSSDRSLQLDSVKLDSLVISESSLIVVSTSSILSPVTAPAIASATDE